MKKLIILLLLLIFTFSCKGNKDNKNNDSEFKVLDNFENIEIINNDLDKIEQLDNIEINNNNSKEKRKEIFSKQLNISISKEHEINQNIFNLPVELNILNSYNTLFYWDEALYPTKINGTNYKCFPIRPPYSNNTIPMASEDELYSYDIKKNIFIKIDNDAYSHYRYSDGFQILSTEWTLSFNNKDYLHLVNKNNKLIEVNILDYLLSEFKNTVFDNKFILDTISHINNKNISFYYEIITRYGMYMRDPFYDDYFLNRLNEYFNVYVIFPSDNNRHAIINIYNDGFSFLEATRVIFFDLKRNQVIEYKFDKSLKELTEGYNNYWVHVSEDNTKFYITTYDNKVQNIYEFKYNFD